MIENLLLKVKKINWKFVGKYLIACYAVSFIILIASYLNSIKGLAFDVKYFIQSFPMFYLISATLLLIPLSIIYGIVRAVFTKQLQLRWKALVVALVLTIGLMLYISSIYEKSAIMRLPPFYLGDIKKYDPTDNYVTAKGMWISDTKLGTPIQATNIDCWRDKGYAIVTDAQLLFGGLSINNTYFDVDKWTDDEITFKDCDSSMYCFYRLHIDRKNKSVTLTRYTKQPKPKEAEDISDEPIYMHLGDGRIK